jgi:hypothetical protein
VLGDSWGSIWCGSAAIGSVNELVDAAVQADGLDCKGCGEDDGQQEASQDVTDVVHWQQQQWRWQQWQWQQQQQQQQQTTKAGRMRLQSV